MHDQTTSANKAESTHKAGTTKAATTGPETTGDPPTPLVIFPDCLSSGSPDGVTITFWSQIHAQGMDDLAAYRTLVVAPWYPAVGSKYRWFPMNLAQVWSQFLSQGGAIVVLVPGSRCVVDTDQFDAVDFPAGRKPADREELRRACLRVLRARASVVPVETERILWTMEALPGVAEQLSWDPDAPLVEDAAGSLLSYLARHPPEMTLQSVPGPSSEHPLEPLASDAVGVPVTWSRTVGRGRLLVVPFNGEQLTKEEILWLDRVAQSAVAPRKVEMPVAEVDEPEVEEPEVEEPEVEEPEVEEPEAAVPEPEPAPEPVEEKAMVATAAAGASRTSWWSRLVSTLPWRRRN